MAEKVLHDTSLKRNNRYILNEITFTVLAKFQEGIFFTVRLPILTALHGSVAT